MSYRRILVIICGCKGNGKDSLADRLAMQFDNAERDSYAAPLKMCVSLKTGIPLKDLNDPEKKEDPRFGRYGKTPRLLMQEEGEEARQRIAPTVWADRLDDRFRASQARVVIVSDGRHPHQEVTGFRQRAPKDTLVVALRVRRPRIVVDRTHISESAIADIPDKFFDAVVVNDGPIEKLALQARQVADLIYLWAITEKKGANGFYVQCPTGGRQRDPRADAQMLATQLMMPCPNCSTHDEHKVERVVYDLIDVQ